MASPDRPLPFSQVPGRPTFRGTAVNAVAMVPLLSTDKEGHESDTNSARSFVTLMQSLDRYSHRDDDDAGRMDLDEVDIQQTKAREDQTSVEDLVLVVPNSQLTRPGDWRYDNTPLRNFHWGHGCQRLLCFDGRPHRNRMAHDRLINPTVSRDWIDLIPSRRTAAVVGILNMKDCRSPADLHRAEQELRQWAERYSAPPYEVTFHGRSFARDEVVQRLFVFDSFHDSCREIDLTKTKLGSNLVAFPPSDSEHTQMMDLHLNVVVNDLAVGIFRQLETKIRESDALCKEKGGGPDARVKTHSLLNTPKHGARNDEPVAKGGNLSVANIANVVSPGNQLASAGTASARSAANRGNPLKSMVETAGRAMHASNRRHTPTPQLLTPLDDVWDPSELNPRDAEAMKKRDIGRREKLAGDLSLLAGSPMDAYERYSRAAEMCKASPDPLWYAAALEGCAAAHIAMAESGGYNVEAYLENNFQLPEEFMALSNMASQDSRKQKQTLPTVVYALCEEALHVTNRHPKLAPLQAELLLKIASYAAEVDDAHARCRWGEGDGCYSGDPTEQRRWDRTSVSKLIFQELKGKEGEDLIATTTAARCQRLTELLHRAVSTGGLSPLTRADVAAACARICLKGVEPTQWKNRPKKERIRLLRKAAFFATVAADCISQCSDSDSTLRGSGMWLVASQFYSRHSNAEGDKDYGWATLRASTLHALSQQEDKLSSEAAAETLLALLSEMSPEEASAKNVNMRASLKALDRALQLDERPITGNSKHSSDGADDRSDTESIVSLSSRMSNYSGKTTRASMSFRSNFFPTHPAAVASLLTVAQAKWAEDDPLPQVQVPLARTEEEDDISSSLISLSCVVPKVRLESCAAAQKVCISHISELRREIPTISSSSAQNTEPHYAFSLAGSPEKGEPIVPPPLSIVSAAVVSSKSNLLLERCKAQGLPGKAGDPSLGSMATFFNPYESKDKAGTVKSALVAKGEEREITIEFGNRLAIPLDVLSCQLEFDNGGTDHIKAPPLSFVIPPKARRFPVNFPFIVLTTPDQPSANESGETPGAHIFDAIGLRVTCLSRCYFIPIGKKVEASEKQMPEAACVYQRLAQYKSAQPDEESKPRVEAVPPQPIMHVSLTSTQADIEDGASIPVPLSDGEIFTIPSFRLQNDFGTSGLGVMEQLQIMAVGLPGPPDKLLFDTNAPVAAESDAGEFEDDELEKEGCPPLKMRAFCDDLSLKSMNDKSKRHGEGNVVTVQIAAAHDMGSQLKKGLNVRIRFRYRGVSTDPAMEIWRKTEVSLKILRVKGPRISSLSFRPDLCWGSAYSELCASFAQQKAEHEAIKKEWKIASRDTKAEKEEDEAVDSSILNRVGMDSGVHVSSSNVVFLMAVANESDSTIVLSNRKGLVGGFEGSPMPTVRITAGVSVKIPVVIPRIKRIKEEEGDVADIAAELITSTALQWESVSVDTAETNRDSDASKSSRSEHLALSSAESISRHGRIRIPSTCLRKIIAEHGSFLSRICEPPVYIKINIGRSESEKELAVVAGAPVDTFVEVETADWVPPDVIDKCRITLEFCAARKDSKPAGRGAFVWCGLIRRTMRLSDTEKKHRARIVFLQEGAFVVSACARLTNENGNGAEETWWAPVAEQVVVETTDAAAQ